MVEEGTKISLIIWWLLLQLWNLYQKDLLESVKGIKVYTISADKFFWLIVMLYSIINSNFIIGFGYVCGIIILEISKQWGFKVLVWYYVGMCSDYCCAECCNIRVLFCYSNRYNSDWNCNKKLWESKQIDNNKYFSSPINYYSARNLNISKQTINCLSKQYEKKILKERQ